MNGKTELNLATIKAAVKAREVIMRHQKLFQSVAEKIQQEGANAQVQPEGYSQAQLGQIPEGGS